MIRIGWIGFHKEGLYAFENLLYKGLELQAFITLNDNAMASRSAGTRKYKQLCGKFNIPYFEVENINDAYSYEILKSLSLDLLIVIGWSQIISPRILRAARLGTVGAHASLLPYNRGSAPVNWAIIRCETLTGNTLIWLDEGVDTGRIIDQIPIPISKYDTCGTIYEEVARSNYIMLNRFISNLNNDTYPAYPLFPEHVEEDIYEEILPRRRPSDGLIRWSQDSNVIYDFIRALTKPYPGAFSFIGGRKWFIWKCALLPTSEVCSPGLVIGPVYSPVEEACGMMVACGRGALELLEIESTDVEIVKGRGLAELDWKGSRWSNE